MNLKNHQILFTCVLMVFSSCKKDEQSHLPNLNNRELQVASAAVDGHLPLTVITIAGKYNTEGYADGVGEQARLLGISGIDLADDGSLYAADTYNHRIRKITMPNIVSTVNIPKNSAGESLFEPRIVRVQSNGTINILAASYDYQNTHSRFWIIKPGSNALTTPARHTVNYSYYGLEKDPYKSYLFIGGSKTNIINGIGYQQSVIEKFLPDADGTYGKDAYFPPKPPLYDNVPYVTSFFCGYNAVKYMVLHAEIICKLTPAGVFQQLYRDHKFYLISDIVATKDSQTLYIAESGAIKAITDGKIRYLVGPHKELKGKDGVGANADVYAAKLALSKDESTLYFSDGHTTIRKLLLR
nr:hypothetical protein [uncultured Mucilaginibacter sp.]